MPGPDEASSSSTSPRSPLAVYRTFLLHNAAQISSVESALRSLSYFLPGRFADADLASEGLFAVVNLISLYHDRILYDAVKQSGTEYKATLANQYHRHWQAESPLVHYTSLALTLFQTVEGVCEMAAAKRWSEKRRWDLIFGIEAVKALLRLTLVARTRQIGLTPATTERDIDPAMVASLPDPSMAQDASSTLYRGSRSGVKLPSVSAMGPDAQPMWKEYLPSKAVRTAFRSPANLLSRLQGNRSVGELLFILRPLVYVYLLRKHGRQSWLPIAVSAIVEAAAYFLVTRTASSRGAATMPTRLERDEYKRRAYNFMFYLLRGPVYDNVSKNVLNSFCETMENKPILRLFSGIVRDYQPLWEHVYFYTSGS
ncbi:peroxisome membrane protein [Blastocladiella britannica]|nr:peroxisome membrane protein [Blastocladiella britannica]